MKGDFTRDTFDPKNRFSRVFMQQGRVTLDADFNEQVAILLHYLRTLARDLIGPYAGPIERGGFALKPTTNGLSIGAGHYYVDGILIENEEDCLYLEQRDYPLPDDAFVKSIKDKEQGEFWLYLDVWERLITPIEDDQIREKALGGADTCSRAKVVWQVKALPLNRRGETSTRDELCDGQLGDLTSLSSKWLAARLDPGQKSDDACVTAPDSRYRGPANQLYRVEIHHGGKASEASFKWSRDNGSVATAWLGTAGNDLQVRNARGFSAGNWVELSDDIIELQGKAGTLVKLVKVEGGLLSLDSTAGVPEFSKLINPKVRRWDQIQTEDIELVDGAVPVNETAPGVTPDKVVWIDLEDGIQVAFGGEGDYRIGDYWLIPARVDGGLLEWPEKDQDGKLATFEPHGVVHHYAPLGIVELAVNGTITGSSCLCNIRQASDCLRLLRSVAVGERLLVEGLGEEPLETRPAPAPPKKTARRATKKRPN